MLPMMNYNGSSKPKLGFRFTSCLDGESGRARAMVAIMEYCEYEDQDGKQCISVETVGVYEFQANSFDPEEPGYEKLGALAPRTTNGAQYGEWYGTRFKVSGTVDEVIYVGKAMAKLQRKIDKALIKYNLRRAYSDPVQQLVEALIASGHRQLWVMFDLGALWRVGEKGDRFWQPER